MEKTLILLKPDTVQRGLIGKVISRIEEKGLQIVGLKMLQLEDSILSEHYSHLTDKPFFPNIVKFMKATPVVALCVQGVDTVNQIRRLVGVTDANKADMGTVRGDYGNSVSCNLIHASDSIENAEIEVARFFRSEEIYEYKRELDSFIFG